MSDMDNDFGFDEYGDSSSEGFSSSAKPSIRGTVKVGKVEYAVDLQWETPQDPGRAAQEAREYAATQSDKPDFFAVYRGVKTQYGLGFSSLGHKTNQPILAAHICANKGANFAALFAVDNGYYLLAVRDDAILSDAERFIDDADEAAQYISRLTSQYEFSEVIAPQSLDIPGSREQSLEAVLSGSPKVRLKDINRSGSLIKIAFVGVLSLIMIFGGKYYYDNMSSEEIEIPIIAPPPEPVVVPPLPWTGKANGARLLEACYNGIQKFPLDIPGWSIDSLACSEDIGLAAYISRIKDLESGGMPISAAEQMVKEKIGAATLQVDGNVDTAGPFGFQWNYSEVSEKYPADLQTPIISKEFKLNILKSFETRRTAVTFSPADENEFWKGITIEFKTSANPLGFADVLAAIPGFMLDSLEYQVTDNIYTVKGKVYEQKPIPKKINAE